MTEEERFNELAKRAKAIGAELQTVLFSSPPSPGQRIYKLTIFESAKDLKSMLDISEAYIRGREYVK